MIILRDVNGNPLGSTIQVSPTSSGVAVYATSDYDGGAVNANWVLKPSGTFTFPSKVHGTSTASPAAPSYFGTLAGFSAAEYVQTITLGPAPMVTFIPNMPTIAVKTIHAVLIASVGGSTASLQIEIQPLSVGAWAQ